MDRLDQLARAAGLCFALPLEPDHVVARLLADGRVAEAKLAALGTVHAPSTRFVLERTCEGFLLAARASEPGAWEPGADTVLEGRISAQRDGEIELELRFRLHPLTRAAYLAIAAVTLLILPLQAWTTGLLMGAAMSFPIVVTAMLLGLDRRRLARQRASLQRLVEEVFAPLVLARESAEWAPFRNEARG